MECHHEYIDGSGFRSLVGPKIYYPARVFRIADEAVIRLNVRQTTGLSILVILAEFAQENQAALKYDQKTIEDLMGRLETG